MKIVCISDTHAKHKKIAIPDGDILIHAGDFSTYGYIHEVESFINWFASHPHPHKVFIAGNHDRSLDLNLSQEYLKWREIDAHIHGNHHPDIERMLKGLPENVHYLNDSGVTIRGVKIWGSPIQPSFGIGWAFNAHRGPDIAKHWEMIPKDTDILITHGPPAYKLDYAIYDRINVGCHQLLYVVEQIKPKMHVFGHIHEGYGMSENDHTLFVNASICTLEYAPTNEPIEVFMCDETSDVKDVGVWKFRGESEHLSRDVAEERYAKMTSRGALPLGDIEFSDLWKPL
jgi:Icc-related predicted phosphoesterase